MVNRVNIINDYMFLQQNVDTISCTPTDFTPEFRIFKERVKNIRDVQDAYCAELKITQGVTDANCKKDKEDDIQLEVKMLARSEIVQNIFENCMKNNDVDIRSPW